MMTVGVQALHGLAAIGLRAPEMECNEAEAKALADPMVRLMDHYAVTPPPEMILWTNMFTALAAVEGPRIMLMRMRLAEERASRAKPVYDSVKPNADTVPDMGATFGGFAPGSGMAN